MRSFCCFKPSSFALFTLSRTRVSTVCWQLNNNCVYFRGGGGDYCFVATCFCARNHIVGAEVMLPLNAVIQHFDRGAVTTSTASLCLFGHRSITPCALHLSRSCHDVSHFLPLFLLKHLRERERERENKKKNVLWFHSAALQMDIQSGWGAGVVLCGCSGSSSSRIYVSGVVI